MNAADDNEIHLVAFDVRSPSELAKFWIAAKLLATTKMGIQDSLRQFFACFATDEMLKSGQEEAKKKIAYQRRLQYFKNPDDHKQFIRDSPPEYYGAGITPDLVDDVVAAIDAEMQGGDRKYLAIADLRSVLGDFEFRFSKDANTDC